MRIGGKLLPSKIPKSRSFASSEWSDNRGEKSTYQYGGDKNRTLIAGPDAGHPIDRRNTSSIPNEHPPQKSTRERTIRARNFRRYVMSRGRQPIVAQEDAKPVAEKRGTVMHYQLEPGSLCDFSIMGPERVAFVRVKRVRRLCCAIEEIARKFAPDIAALRIIASVPAISREIWIYSPKGVFRFFRICDASIIELGRDGMQLATGPALAPAAASSGPVPASK